MSLRAKDKAFRLPKISVIDFKSIEMDRSLTALFARIHHQGMDSRLSKPNTTLEDFEQHILEKPDRFKGFSSHQGILRGWLESHLLDLVNRGKYNQQVSAPRPLHGYTYRFRNPKHCRDYGSAEHLYETLWHARNNLGQLAIDSLRQFFFEGVDPNTQREDTAVKIDVETQALLSLSPNEMREDAPVRGSRNPTPPLCVGSADLLADDLLRLMQYRTKIPRSVMVDYLKILFAFHLGLYHLRLLKMLPELVKRKGNAPSCEASRCPVKPGNACKPQGDCPFRIGLFVDVRNHPGTLQASLAEASAEFHYRRIPGFVKSYYLVRKLDEYASDLLAKGRIPGGANRHLSVPEVLGLLNESYATDREAHFGSRMYNLTQDLGEDGALDPEIEKFLHVGLNNFDTYIECLMALRGDYQRSFVVKCLDAFLLKNRPGALIAQARSSRAPRRFILDSRLLELLLQINVLQYDPAKGSYKSEEMQIEKLLDVLKRRYGLHIDSLPVGEGFQVPSIDQRSALKDNRDAFKDKLREIGFFQDLSDAYVTQHVRPRYQID